MLLEPEKTSIPVSFLESCFNVFSFTARLHFFSPIILRRRISALFSSIIYMLIFFAITPHKLLSDLALNSGAEGVILIFSSFQVNSSARFRGGCQTQQRRGHAVTVHKAVTPGRHEWTTFVELLIYTVSLLAFSASAAAATTRGSNNLSPPTAWKGAGKAPPPPRQKRWIRQTYTHIKGWLQQKPQSAKGCRPRAKSGLSGRLIIPPKTSHFHI